MESFQSGGRDINEVKFIASARFRTDDQLIFAKISCGSKVIVSNIGHLIVHDQLILFLIGGRNETS